MLACHPPEILGVCFFVVSEDNPQGYRRKIIFQAITLIAVCVTVPIALWIAVRIASVFTPMAPSPSHSDVVTTVLAGLTISIAVLALMVAGLAIWGYHAIKAEARKTAIRAARVAAIKSVKSADVQNRLRKEARLLIAGEFAKWKEANSLFQLLPPQGQSTMKAGEQPPRTGKSVPKLKKEAQSEDKP